MKGSNGQTSAIITIIALGILGCVVIFALLIFFLGISRVFWEPLNKWVGEKYPSSTPDITQIVVASTYTPYATYTYYPTYTVMAKPGMSDTPGAMILTAIPLTAEGVSAKKPSQTAVVVPTAAFLGTVTVTQPGNVPKASQTPQVPKTVMAETSTPEEPTLSPEDLTAQADVPTFSPEELTAQADMPTLSPEDLTAMAEPPPTFSPEDLTAMAEPPPE